MTKKLITLDNNLVIEINLSKKYAKVVNSPDAKTDVFIPKSVFDDENEYNITEIGDRAFFGNAKITSISFPEDSEVRSFGLFSLSCFLKKLMIPPKLYSLGSRWCENTVYLTEIDVSESNENFIYVNGILFSTDMKVLYFVRRDLEELVIPNTVKRIAEFACEKAVNLKSVNFVENSILECVGRSAFRFCSSLKNIELPATVKRLNDSCFLGSGIEEVICNGPVGIIGSSCFYNTPSLLKVSILNSRKIDIGLSAFDKTLSPDFHLILTEGIEITGKGAPKSIEFMPNLNPIPDDDEEYKHEMNPEEEEEYKHDINIEEEEEHDPNSNKNEEDENEGEENSKLIEIGK